MTATATTDQTDSPGPAAKRAAADQLLEAVRTKTACRPVRTLLPGATVRDAYDVQALLTQQALDEGRRIVGRKIGLTSRAVQTQLGVDQPDFGTLFADMAFSGGETLPIGRLLQPRVEAEVAFVLATDLTATDVTATDVIRATDFVVPAIEVVDSRVAGWDITIIDTVADNASSGLFVTGTRPVRLENVDLASTTMELRNANGDIVSSGSGRACLGDPLVAVVWLARALASVDQPLRAGDVVLSGALGPMFTAEPGTAFTATINGLGTVQFAFSTE